MLGHNPIVIHRLNLVKNCLQTSLSHLDSILTERPNAGNLDPDYKILTSMIEDALDLLRKDQVKKPVQTYRSPGE